MRVALNMIGCIRPIGRTHTSPLLRSYPRLWNIHLGLVARFDYEALRNIKDADGDLANLEIETGGSAVVTQILMVAPPLKSIKQVSSRYCGGPVNGTVKPAFLKHASTLEHLSL